MWVKQSKILVTESFAISKADVVEQYLLKANKEIPIVISPYHWPDLDGIACAYAMEEVMKLWGFSSVRAMIAEEPQREAIWAMNQLGISLPQISLEGYEDIILVDTSDPLDIPSFIQPHQVKAILDHRSYHTADSFPNAVAQIEQVGAAATLVAEVYLRHIPSPSREAVFLLCAAIASNTANFKSSGTTARDIMAANRLQELSSFDALEIEKFVADMLLAKSDFSNVPMIKPLGDDLSSSLQTIAGVPTAVAQLEIVCVQHLLLSRGDEIKETLHTLKTQRGAESIWLIAIDLNEGKTFFVFLSDHDKVLVGKVIPFQDNGFVNTILDCIMTRKEVIHKLKEYYRD
ncbi:putative manganese-dependent inorganic pyrophosphatase (plasmid) [Scytonema sp. HK-05]|uniref:DHH family phosphoesterase n=1 Tax=Scytonema sp. HK-05 TaxID=1137095 RepID=UPI000937E60B|nr:DHH family phosphoesterase [Scytonema sp. HK-05]OKH48881.1 hypothetical protein NIES2130_35100 [Scytonema sp. HK-05]BAY50634.1 putative manganese-dependent inorganic pyrophosphatase [Scytonema sp. HK-05]